MARRKGAPRQTETRAATGTPVIIDDFIEQLFDGREDERQALINSLASGSLVGDHALADRIIDELTGQLSPWGAAREIASRARSDIPKIRSWMLSALIWIDPEYGPSERMLISSLHREGDDKGARFWVLAGLGQRNVSYLPRALAISREDVAPEVRLLAEVLTMPSAAPERLSMALASNSFLEGVWPALRVLRTMPIPQLLPEVCALLLGETRDPNQHYDALYALTNPHVLERSADVLLELIGLDRLVTILLDVMATSDRRVGKLFAPLCVLFDQRQLEEAFRKAPNRQRQLRRLRGEITLARRQSNPLATRNSGFDNDSDEALRDDLGIDQEVQSLAAVMLAKSTLPPLAIGLFGDWGSGKSFFMSAMRKATAAICEASAKTEGATYCANAVSIRFNAWHYADTHLWASLVSEILEQLAAHVSPRDTPEQEEARLVGRLTEANAAKEAAEKERDAKLLVLKEEQGLLQKAQIKREQQELRLQDMRLADFRLVLETDTDLKARLDTALADLGLPAAITSATDLQAAIQEANSLGGKAWGLVAALKKQPQTAWKVILLLAVPLIIGWLVVWFAPHVGWFSAIAGEVAALAGAAALTIRKALPLINTHYRALETAKRQLDEALAKRREVPSEEEKKLLDTIAGLRAEEEQSSQKLKAAIEQVAELERRITELRDQRTLGAFLNERTASDDYRKHLGLMSTIRRDFKALTDRLAKQVGPGQKPVDRIILYIDDLDRCPAPKVIEVLEAVHLLLAFKLFVVVVGVDPRWLSHALRTTYGALKGEDGEAPWITPRNYLEKIFQIPILLKPMSSQGYGALVRNLMSPVDKDEETFIASGGLAEPDASQVRGEQRPKLETDEPSDMLAPPAARWAADAAGNSDGRNRPPSLPFQMHVPVDAEALAIVEVEVEFAEHLHSLLPTPRSVKRFVNTYRLIKASVSATALGAFEGTVGQPGHFQIPMLLLAVLIGAGEKADDILKAVQTDAIAGADPVAALEAAASGSHLGEALHTIVNEQPILRSPVLFAEWTPRVRHYSFGLSRSAADSR